MEVTIKDYLEGNTALAPSKGYPIHDAIKQALDKKELVYLDFNGMELMTTAFLNAVIGKLYSEFTSEYLNTYLKIKYISQSDVVLLKKVIDTAKLYFANPEAFENHMNQKFNNE
ncbi:STAS-like domain-containing protein [Mucilaginibacter sp. FT3.2]|uniref:STAS-like domain-containing protein n=1 Tax=Mucilaginibacter sp. FT3.2 TaxID=2723090 RepID=UPI00161017C7|nr:STAS-like domain-containing protein [Mucilaginibacter sp. FT3.2]MBB6234008.1 hypothetical protein [Mucilaginibacter sp. FT3.2]